MVSAVSSQISTTNGQCDRVKATNQQTIENSGVLIWILTPWLAAQLITRQINRERPYSLPSCSPNINEIRWTSNNPFINQSHYMTLSCFISLCEGIHVKLFSMANLIEIEPDRVWSELVFPWWYTLCQKTMCLLPVEYMLPSPLLKWEFVSYLCTREW